MEEVMVNVRTLQKYDVANKLKEVNSSKAYLDMGYTSITEYAEKELKKPNAFKIKQLEYNELKKQHMEYVKLKQI